MAVSPAWISGPLRRSERGERMRRRLVAASAVLGCTLGLFGCASGQSVPTATGAAVAAVVADTVELQVDIRPSVDCGDERVGITDGTVVDCTVTDPTDELSYDARVRIINPDGGDRYSVSLDVANDPKH